MTGVNEKLDKLLEDVAAMREHVANLEDQVDELKTELKPVFFQASAIKFSGILFASLISLIVAIATCFPALGAAVGKALVSTLLKGAL